MQGRGRQQPKPPAKVTIPICSIAKETAAKAKQVYPQNLRNKVYGKGKRLGEGPGKGEASTKAVERDGADADKDEDDKPQHNKRQPLSMQGIMNYAVRSNLLLSDLVCYPSHPPVHS